MGKNRIQGSLLALSLCFLAFPTSGLAESNGQSSKEQAVEVLTNVEGKEVTVKQQVTKGRLLNEDIVQMVDFASKAVSEEKEKDKKSKNSNANGTYNFISDFGDYMYVYEETQNNDPILTVTEQPESNQTKDLVDLPAESESVDKGTSNYAIGTDFMKDGIGGKQNITLTNSTYLSTLLKLPTSADPGSWNYGGFDYNSGTAHYSGEMGLQYYNNLGPADKLKGWKPVLIFVKTVGNVRTKYTVGFDPNYKQVQLNNGYAEGVNINYYTYYNYDGYVRMKLTGTAICADLKCDSEKPTQLTTIMQTSQTVNLSTIDNYKLVTTIVTPKTTGNNKGIFSNIKVGTTSVPSAYFAKPMIDRATITRDANNTVTIVVD